MNIENEITYQLLHKRIQPALLNLEFQKRLAIGKYSRWAKKLTTSEIIPLLSAIGRLAQLSPDFSDLTSDFFLHPSQLRDLPETKRTLSDSELNMLDFIAKFARYGRDDTIPVEFTQASPDFVDTVNWAMSLTSSDLFGVLWHIGGFWMRYEGEECSSISLYHERAQECLIALIRLAQGQCTYYYYGGTRIPLGGYAPEARMKLISHDKTINNPSAADLMTAVNKLDHDDWDYAYLILTDGKWPNAFVQVCQEPTSLFWGEYRDGLTQLHYRTQDEINIETVRLLLLSYLYHGDRLIRFALEWEDVTETLE